MAAPAETDPEASTPSATHDHAGAEGAPTSRNDVVRVDSAKLPVPLPARPIARSRRWWRVAIVLLVLGVAGGGTALYWLKYHQPTLPPGIVWGNARLEADEIDIATKFAGRIAQLFVDEGDPVVAGQVLARMDTQDLEASLKKAEAQAQQAQHALDEAQSTVVQRQSQLVLAQQELERTQPLAQRGISTKEQLDQRRQQVDAATAVLNAANFRVLQTERAIEAAKHDIELLQVNIADNTLRAPRDGRIQYRVANVGEVLAAGGKVFTMLDLSNVYMDFYLPTAEAGKIKIGDDARIVLDARPQLAIPAKVTFVAAKAQFTPKAVETRSEREKLMFRVRIRINPDVLRAHADAVISGVPGLAYVKLDPQIAWPDRLQGPRRG
jgi:HlyD family secretion protein